MKYRNRVIKVGDIFESDSLYSPFEVMEVLENVILFEDSAGDTTAWVNEKKMESLNLRFKKSTARWKPKENQDYYFIDSAGVVEGTCYESEYDSDRFHLSVGNCFETEEEAEKYTLQVVRKDGKET